MIRNFKILGLALAATWALAAVGASVASAAATDFTAGSTSGTIHTEQTTEQVLTTNAGTTRCTTSTQSGPFTAATITHSVVVSSYAGCKAFGFLTGTVDMNGCEYTFAGGEETTAFMSIVNCTNAAKSINITTLSCIIHIPEQGPIAHVVYSNTTTKNPDDVDVNFTLSGIKYTATSGCPGEGVGVQQSNGTLSGGATLIAKNTAGTQVNLTVN